MFLIWKSSFSQRVTVNNHQIFHSDNQKKPVCASKRDKLVLATLQYMIFYGGVLTESLNVTMLVGDTLV